MSTMEPTQTEKDMTVWPLRLVKTTQTWRLRKHKQVRQNLSVRSRDNATLPVPPTMQLVWRQRFFTKIELKYQSQNETKFNT